MNNVVCFSCRYPVLSCTCNNMSLFFNRIRASVGIYVQNDLTYQERINKMTKHELFAEMDKFTIYKRSRRSLSMSECRNGIILFNKLAEVVDLPETKKMFINYSAFLALQLERAGNNENNVVDLNEFRATKKMEDKGDNPHEGQ